MKGAQARYLFTLPNLLHKPSLCEWMTQELGIQVIKLMFLMVFQQLLGQSTAIWKASGRYSIAACKTLLHVFSRIFIDFLCRANPFLHTEKRNLISLRAVTTG
jgi:hypothetical protein